MTMLPPPPPPSGRHPILRSPLPPPPDRRHSGLELIEKPSVRPFLLDIQEDEFRSGHLLPKFPPVEALPKIDLAAEERKLRRRHWMHVFEVAAAIAAAALIGVAGRNATAVSASTAVGSAVQTELDPFPNLFPIEPFTPMVALAPPPQVFPATPPKTTAPTPPAAATPKAAAVAKAPAAAVPAKPVEPSAPAAPKPPEPKPEPENPTLGVENPGF